MVRQFFNKRRGIVLIDINTQNDFFMPEGKARIRNHKRVLANVRRIMAWARRQAAPVISICEVYPDDNGWDGQRYCVDGTLGQKKVGYTILNNRVNYAADGTTDLPRDVLQKHRQLILHKRVIDPFDEPRIERLFTELSPKEFLVVGACSEGAVKGMVLGLRQRGKNVTVVKDAVGGHNKREAKLAIRKMQAKGARLIDTRKLAGKSHLRFVLACERNKSKTKSAPEAVWAGNEKEY